jgi:coenzyme F420-reducing hydrogenase beta subunit
MDEGTKSPSISIVGDRCCGCGSCVAVCPVLCLTMRPDACGFVHPVYETGCIGCGRCAKACPALTVGNKDQVASVTWAKAKDDRLRDRSSSGAVFGLLAKKVLDEGGVVYGAAFSEDCRTVGHVRVDSAAKLDTVMRSKYVQSDVGLTVYEGVKTDLNGGIPVLFAGTACQNAAIRNYLSLQKVSMANLLLVEVICHGVPSPKLWSEWLDYVSREAGSVVDFVNFRSKSTGWLTFSVAYSVATEKVRSEENSRDWYMRAFLWNASLRESCLDCPAKRCCGSDITLGDFWGIQNIHSEVVDNLGVSAVICNTGKGTSALDSVHSSLEMGTSSMEEVVPGNPALVHSVEPYGRRDEFLADVANSVTIDDLIHKWTFEPSLKQRVRGKLSGLKHKMFG